MNNIFDYLKVQGFRGLKSLELSDLGKVNIFVGDNNSGKTSLLEAISIFCNPLDAFQWLGASQRRSYVGGKHLETRPDLETVKWISLQEEKIDFIDEPYQGEITIEAKGTTPIIKLDVKLSAIEGIGEISNSKRFSDDDISNKYVESGIELEVIAHLVKPNPNLFGDSDLFKKTYYFWETERFIQRKRYTPYIKNATIFPAYSESESILYRLTEIIKEGDGKEEVIQVLRLFDKNITDIEILSTPKNRAILSVNHQILGRTPLSVFGDGFKRALIIAITLMSIENGILLIDEIETSIYVSALSELFSWLVKTCQIRGIQLFVTTHSLEAVDAMLAAINDIDDIVGFKLNKEGLPPQRFTGDILDGLRERGLDVRGK